MSDVAVDSPPRSILLPLDGSNAADRAVPFAREVAVRGGVPVTVLHVFSSIKSLSSVADGEIAWTQSADPRASIRPPASIRSAVDELRAAGISVNVTGRLGDVATQISAEAETMANPWIAMASLGATGIRRHLMGTNALKTVRAARCPVLIVPVSPDDGDGIQPTAAPILVFLDGTGEAEEALPVACSAARMFDSRLDIVRVAETLDDRDTDHVERVSDERLVRPIIESVQAYCEEIRERCGGQGINAKSVPLSGSPAVQIQRYVDETSPAMVVLVTRRRSGIERWTYGSFAERLVGALPTPTLLVPVDPVDPTKGRD
jgi:nucleotide-binding universal stress UspA family protein